MKRLLVSSLITIGLFAVVTTSAQATSSKTTKQVRATTITVVRSLGSGDPTACSSFSTNAVTTLINGVNQQAGATVVSDCPTALPYYVQHYPNPLFTSNIIEKYYVPLLRKAKVTVHGSNAKVVGRKGTKKNYMQLTVTAVREQGVWLSNLDYRLKGHTEISSH